MNRTKLTENRSGLCQNISRNLTPACGRDGTSCDCRKWLCDFLDVLIDNLPTRPRRCRIGLYVCRHTSNTLPLRCTLRLSASVKFSIKLLLQICIIGRVYLIARSCHHTPPTLTFIRRISVRSSPSHAYPTILFAGYASHEPTARPTPGVLERTM